jgi:L-alanine-DL-glutamate epimerase-like enolase superfamily enzyme
VNLRFGVHRARFRAPFAAAYGDLFERPLIVVALEGSDGVTGYGEAAPLEPYDGVSVEGVLGGLADCVPVLRDVDGAGRGEALSACRAVTSVVQALAAIDLALWDLAGRRAGEPVWRLLGARAAAALPVNATIGATAAAEAARAAGEAAAAAFRCVKVKVGTGDDAGRLAAVRAAVGPSAAIRIDANGAWSVAEAAAALAGLAGLGIELCEEPCAGAAAIRELWVGGTPVPLALDESASSALDERCADAVCLKIAGGGGISGVIEQARRARRAGYDVYLASTFDGPLGIAAAVHAAAAIEPRRACGLATLELFDRPDPVPPRGGALALPDGPGLGEGLIGWYGPLALER